jgi:hypothetical protein
MIFKIIIDFFFKLDSIILNIIPVIPGSDQIIPHLQSGIDFIGDLTSWTSFWFPINTLLFLVKFDIAFRAGIFLYRVVRDLLSLVTGGIIKK